MKPFNNYVEAYLKQMDKGDVPKAYRGLMEYLMGLRTHLKKYYPDHYVSGLYQGYMDMSYFTFTPPVLKKRSLKVALVFVHDGARFEAWLAGNNRRVQKEYWERLKGCGYDRYRLPVSIRGRDSIVEHTLVAQPDFDDLEGLTNLIETGLLAFAADVDLDLAEMDDGCAD